jgi:hypothetical protein
MVEGRADPICSEPRRGWAGTQPLPHDLDDDTISSKIQNITNKPSILLKRGEFLEPSKSMKMKVLFRLSQQVVDGKYVVNIEA